VANRNRQAWVLKKKQQTRSRFGYECRSGMSSSSQRKLPLGRRGEHRSLAFGLNQGSRRLIFWPTADHDELLTNKFKSPQAARSDFILELRKQRSAETSIQNAHPRKVPRPAQKSIPKYNLVSKSMGIAAQSSRLAAAIQSRMASPQLGIWNAGQGLRQRSLCLERS
jgi:hypothetical protein